jgi:hypothetical protein
MYETRSLKKSGNPDLWIYAYDFGHSHYPYLVKIKNGNENEGSLVAKIQIKRFTKNWIYKVMFKF